MTPQKVTDFIAAWASQKNGATLPEKSRLDLKAFKEFLPNMMVLELDGDDLIYRLVGTALDVTRGPTVGTSLFDYYPPEIAILFRHAVAVATSCPAGFAADYVVELETGFRANRYSIYLPLIGGNPNPFLLSYVHYFEEHVSSPFSKRAIRLRARSTEFNKLLFHDLGHGTPTLDKQLLAKAEMYFDDRSP